MIDLHNHTPWCHHATGRPAEYLEAARRAGMKEFGFAEHSPWMFQYEGEQIAPTPEEFESYLEEVLALRASAPKGGPALRIGIEADFIPGLEDHAKSFLDAHPFDFRIGSVHNIGDWIFDHPGRLGQWEGRDVDAVFTEYYKLIEQMVRWGEIDIIAHLDLPKKFGHRPSAALDSIVTDLLDLIAESGVVVEINTAGRRYPAAEDYPSPSIIRELIRRQIPLTISSDAHTPDRVGTWHHDVLAMLRALGVKEIYSFEGRQKVGFGV